MRSSAQAHSWFGPSQLAADHEPFQDTQEFDRLWRGFMTARVTLSLVLLLLQLTLYGLARATSIWLVLICGAHFVSALLLRLLSRPRALGRTFNPLWGAAIGVDVLVFAVLQIIQGGSINYTPLFALPVLLASVLGSLPLALGTAASVSLLLLVHAAWLAVQESGDVAPHFIQASLTGAGSFVVAVLAHQLSTRLASEEQRARRNQLAARMQQQVNDLVIESLSDGVLVVDVRGDVRAANPAARYLLQSDDHPLSGPSFNLLSESAWQPLAEQVQQCFARQAPQEADVNIQHANQGPRRARVGTRLTASHGIGAERLCVMFLQDQREMEARLRTEKLASMGRMSAAVAHEIRNPLAAITQANALLDEDIDEPRHKQLTLMVQQNAHRLEKIVEEVLTISRVQDRQLVLESKPIDLREAVERVCRDWAGQNQCASMLRVQLPETPLHAVFDPEHLRRVLVNLLDNARRYASRQTESIQVSCHETPAARVLLSVWSDGPPMEQSVERHLFEPFFSSESRSSGLGLYICRELCEGHGATIAYQRSKRTARGMAMEGNEFFVSLRQPSAVDTPAPSTGWSFSPWH